MKTHLSRSLALLAILYFALSSILLAIPAEAASPNSWNFTVDVGLPSTLVSKYGGKAGLESDVNTQLAQISSRYTGFSANITFKANNFFVFNGNPPDYLTTPHPNSDFILVYDEGNDQGGWFGNVQGILHDWPADQGGIFSAYATDGLTHEFGHSRGAIDEYEEAVLAANNPVSGTSFTPPPSTMVYPYGPTIWDPYTVGIINASGSTIYSGAPIVDKAFPEMRIRVKTAAGSNVASAQISLYPVSWTNQTVQTTPVLTGQTGPYGWYVLPSNPFEPGIAGEPWNLAYPNFLIKVTSGTSTKYGWLPVTGVGAWYFQHPGTPFTRNITL